MAVVKLFCAVVGVQGSAFSVKIDASESVDDLKKAIKVEKMYQLPADELQLFLAKKDGAWLTEADVKNGVEDTTDLKLLDAARARLQRVGLSDQDVGGVDEEEEAEGRGPVNVLVVVPAQEPPVNPPQIFPTYRPNAEGIDLNLPHLSRDELVQKLYSAIIGTNFVLLSSPAGSGKTSLLTLFARRYPGFRYVPIAFDSATADATMILSSHGIDICGKKCLIPEGELCVFMMDDCQRQYKDLDFWTGLIKGSSSWLPKHVRFIISATHLLETDAPTSPVAFSSIPWKLTREDFLISDVEAHECLELENGLPPSLRYPTFLEVIIRECNGHIGSLRVSINTIYAHFQKADPTEHDLLTYYMSGAFVDQMARCFGSDHTTPTHPDQQKFLTMCLVGDPTCQPLVQKLSHDEKQCFTRLKKAGIVFEDGGYVKFTSPLAERYYYKWLFPGRGYANPTSLYELVRKAIGSMSASVLKQSVVREYDFPKEAVFQHQFMAALALHTTSTCYICPELSRVFPASPRQRSQRIDGEIDFYLNGSLRWGIELLVNGDKIGEHMSRFAPKGKYAALAAKAYAVIDFRGNKTGQITEVARKPERVTVFFKLGDFSSCRCIFGLVEDAEPISLKY